MIESVMPVATSSEITTAGIKIKAEPQFMHERSLPEEGQYIFSYKITISNESDAWVKLKSRHWIIIDSNGKREDVYGPGVVGEEPELFPGESYSYSSFCPLTTDFGTMEGSYKMIHENGEIFEVKIARFYLTTNS